MVPKLCGQDIELGNFILGDEERSSTGAEASRALLRAIDGYPAGRVLASGGGRLCPCGCGAILAGAGADAQDWGRKWLENGSCCYIDLNHLELATAETTSAFDQVACTHAMLRIAQRALATANASRPPGRAITALVNNSDRAGNSYGSHANFLVTRPLWDQIFWTRLHYLLYLASFQVSSLIFTGQGKVGSENGRPDVPYQLSQRADFFETMTGPQTTTRRPIVNSRDEALCGGWAAGADSRAADSLARLHVIFFDATLCHCSTLLKIGTMQLLLAMMERGLVDRSLILDDPLGAVLAWSRDPALRTRAELADGRRLTAVDLQSAFFDRAERFVASGECDGLVPQAAGIIALWGRVLETLRAGRSDELEGQLDWVLKQSLLRRAMARRPALSWTSPQIRHLDLIYSSLAPDEGLFWACDQEGLVEHVVPDGRIDELTRVPPADTRAWTRGTLLRHAGAAGVDDADWDWVRVSTTGRYGWREFTTIRFPDPLSCTRAANEAAFEHAPDLDTVIRRLIGPHPASPGYGRRDHAAISTADTRRDAT
jgi:Pup amidohydrolase